VAAIDAGRLAAVTGSLRDLVRGLGVADFRAAMTAEFGLIPRALRQTLPHLLTAKGDEDASILKVALENARVDPYGLALEMGDEQYTWAGLDEATSRVAHVLSSVGVRPGDVVALMAQNSPLYLGIVLGANRLGATCALINSHLEGHPLSHAIRASGARVVITERPFAAAVQARDDLADLVSLHLTYGDGELDQRLRDAPGRRFERVPMRASDDYVYIYTSGTTGLPKPCRISHGRAVAGGAAFGPLFFGFDSGDKLYNVLPLYHSNALLLGTGACMVTRTPMAMRTTFSAKAFWTDAVRYRATAMIYIGELCRYLVNTPPCEAEKANTIRVALGNGLRADVWGPFQSRFGIENIREFYGATEAPGILVNLTNRVGSVGRVPMRRAGPIRVVRYDIDSDTHVRDSSGSCVECGPDEVGEMLIKLEDEPRTAASEFRGYTDPAATEKKLVRDVFEKGDRFYRSGDLMRYDALDYFYFVDRIGDTYRWKGENVSTAEVADVLAATPGVREITVCGIHIPGAEGQAGLAAVVAEGDLDPADLWRVAQELPSYAQPRFIRVIDAMSTTATFKIQKANLRKEGVDPVAQAGRVFLRTEEGYTPLTPALWADVQEGRARL